VEWAGGRRSRVLDRLMTKVRVRRGNSQRTGPTAPSRRSVRDRCVIERYVARPAERVSVPPKFHLVPENGWNDHTRKLRCGMSNVIEWDGELPLPAAPRTPCWLLPAKDDMALCISRLQQEILAAGWKVLTCDEKVIDRLSNKASLSEYAKRLGMQSHLPAHYARPEEARYPCLLKAAVGEHGQNIHIVNSAADVLAVTSDGFGTTWLLEEMCDGSLELSVSLLVVAGEILDAVCTEYEYDSEQYVWPHVGEVGRRSYDNIPLEHLAVMKDFLQGYSGICNFNYKVRPNGRMCIFEVNTRVGADLACDVPRPRARALFAKMDSIWEDIPAQSQQDVAGSKSSQSGWADEME